MSRWVVGSFEGVKFVLAGCDVFFFIWLGKKVHYMYITILQINNNH